MKQEQQQQDEDEEERGTQVELRDDPFTEQGGYGSVLKSKVSSLESLVQQWQSPPTAEPRLPSLMQAWLILPCCSGSSAMHRHWVWGMEKL